MLTTGMSGRRWLVAGVQFGDPFGLGVAEKAREQTQGWHGGHDEPRRVEPIEDGACGQPSHGDQEPQRPPSGVGAVLVSPVFGGGPVAVWKRGTEDQPAPEAERSTAVTVGKGSPEMSRLAWPTTRSKKATASTGRGSRGYWSAQIGQAVTHAATWRTLKAKVAPPPQFRLTLSLFWKPLTRRRDRMLGSRKKLSGQDSRHIRICRVGLPTRTLR